MKQEAVLFTQIPFEDIKCALTVIVRNELKSELQALVPTTKPEDLLSRKQTAKVLGISLPTLHLWTLEGKIPAYRIASRVRYKRSEVEQSLTIIKSAKAKA
jgi:excisionase family DNA binding protein